MSPLRQPAKFFWAFAKWLIAHGLKCFEFLTAFLTGILVGGHDDMDRPLSRTRPSLHQTKRNSSSGRPHRQSVFYLRFFNHRKRSPRLTFCNDCALSSRNSYVPFSVWGSTRGTLRYSSSLRDRLRRRSAV